MSFPAIFLTFLLLDYLTIGKPIITLIMLNSFIIQPFLSLFQVLTTQTSSAVTLDLTLVETIQLFIVRLMVCAFIHFVNSLVSIIFLGALLQYVLLQMGCFFLCHLSFFFYNVVFPFHASQFKNKIKKRRCVYLFTMTICKTL